MIRVHNTQYSLFLRQADVLRRSGTLCDAVISVESQVFRAHRLVLACASKTLEHQLTLQAAYSDQPDRLDQPYHCSLELLSPHTFQQVLDFAYTETLEVPVDDLPQLLRAAKLLEMHSLEEQCRSQLKRNLGCLMRERRELREIRVRGTKETREMTETRELQITEERDEKEFLKGSPIPEEGDPQTIPSIDLEPQSSPFTKDPTLPDTRDNSSGSSPPQRKRPKLLTPTLVTTTPPPSRDSVIATTAATIQPPLPPPPASRVMWHQVNTLTRMALNYNDILAASSSSLQPSQHLVTYPFHLSTPHMYPLLTSSIPPQVRSSVLGYPGILHPYHHPLLSGSRELGDILTQDLLGKRVPMDKVLIGGAPGEGQRYSQERPGRTQDCQHCSKVLLGSSWLQASTTNPSGSGETSLGCKYCDRGFRVERSLPSHRRDQGGEKPYQCKRCSKRFSLKHQLDTHHRVHTGPPFCWTVSQSCVVGRCPTKPSLRP
ncbi:zinc finger and BTB domain-containing protein 18.2 isoform X2 [Salmo trutta]|uniref:Zinc finger and BTB domain-containing protein 16-like n=1 Tax=Salmo trutta TaxID=8032 RepID=A0A673XE71_SALTR|nr:zinc finger and BTB domain-containing protein 18.2-like isoform X2 [Salmo trutta]